METESAGVRRQRAQDPATPPAELSRLLEDGNFWVRRDAARNPRSPADHLDLLRRAGSSADLAGHAPPDASVTAESLEQLSRGGEWARRLAARHPATTATTLERLSRDVCVGVRAAVAVHANTPAEIIRNLTVNADQSVRQVHPTANTKQLRKLAASDDPTVQQAVAEHPNTAAATLAELSQSSDARVRHAVARHRKTPKKTLRVLLLHGAADIRSAAAQNANAPTGLLQLLRRAGASADLTTVTEPDTALLPSSLYAVAKSPFGRLLAARHPKTSRRMLTKLLEDADFSIRHAAALHPRTPKSALMRLVRAGSDPSLEDFGNPDRNLELAELQSLSTGGTWARILVSRHPNTTAELLAELSRDTDGEVRKHVARHRNVSVTTLVALASDPMAAVRWAVVKRDGLPRESLECLSQDSAPNVREYARQRLLAEDRTKQPHASP